MRFKTLIAGLMLLLVQACATTNAPVGGYPLSTDPASDSYIVISTLFATDRSVDLRAAPNERFGSGRSELKYGVAHVSIPMTHELGALESPSVMRLEFSERPDRHVMLMDVTVWKPEEYFDFLRFRVTASARRNVLVFVHGYNVSFSAAARRTAQMAYDLGFDGAPIFYSWPSKGEEEGYFADEESIKWTEAHLEQFLEEVLTRSEAEAVYLVAHSMGNRAVTRAVTTVLNRKPELRPKLKELILAAPDIDADVFRDRIAPALVKAADNVTLYAASGDLALAASRTVHQHPRAGDSGEQIVVVPGIETIDASGQDTSFLGHSYFAETGTLIADLYQLISHGQRAHDRKRLVPVGSGVQRYWRMVRQSD